MEKFKNYLLAAAGFVIVTAIVLAANPRVGQAQASGESLRDQIAALQKDVTPLQTALTKETTRAEAAEATLTSNLTKETTRAEGVESTLTTNLKNEVTRAKAAEATLTANLSALQTTVTSQGAQIVNLQTTVSAQASAINSIQSMVTSQGTQIGALQAQTQYISTGTDESGYPAMFITKCNVWVQDGSGSTNDGGGPLTGLGNLIIGYNALGNPRFGDFRSGSHNLILGDENGFAGYGGAIAGFQNTIFNAYTCVMGGQQNAASGDYSSVAGGFNNETSGYAATVSGGLGNTADGASSSVSGGANLFQSNTFGWSAGSLGSTGYGGNFTSP